VTDYFETLSCTATNNTTLTKVPDKVLRATAVSVPKLVKLVMLIRSVTAVASPKIIRSLLRSISTNATNAITIIGNAIRPRINAIGELDSKWTGIAIFQLFPSIAEFGYDGRMEAGELE